MPVLMGVPMHEGNVFGRHLDEPRARLDKPPREQAAETEPAHVVLLVAFFWFLGQVERRALFAVEQAMRVLDRADDRLLVIVAGDFAERPARDHLAQQLLALAETFRRHA